MALEGCTETEPRRLLLLLPATSALEPCLPSELPRCGVPCISLRSKRVLLLVRTKALV